MARKVKKLTFAELCARALGAKADTNWVKEDTNLAATGNVLKKLAHPGAPKGVFGDAADTGTNINVASVGTFVGKYGTLVLLKNGSYTYHLNNSNPTVKALNPNDPALVDTFIYKITNGHTSVKSTLKISIFGTNDGAPSIHVEKTAEPASIHEGGQSVAYTYAVTNTSAASTDGELTLTSLKDDRGTAGTGDDVNLLNGFVAGVSHGTHYVGGDTDNDYKVDANETWTFNFTTNVGLNAGGSLTNVVTATGKDNEGDSATDTDDATTTATDVKPTITVTKQVDANSDQQFQDSESISEGTPTTVTYKVTITNTSNAQDPVTLTSILDDQIANDAALLAAAIAANGNSATLAPGASLTFTYTSDAALTLNGNGQFVNTISVSGHDDEGTPASGGDTATVTGAAASPTITVTKQVDANSDQQFQDSESISEGTPTTVTYKVTITNTSNAQDPVTLTSILDDQIANDAALLAAAIAANGNSATLAPGASLTFTYTSDAALTLNGNGQFVNTISVSGHDDEGTPASGGDTATVTGAAASPTITVTKQVDANSDQQFQDSESISEGTPTTVTYKVTITNTSNAQDPVTLTSILDDQIANDAALLAAAIAANGNSATLAPGASLTFTYTSDAALTLNGNGQFVNTISVSGHDDEGTPASGGDTATVTGAAASPTITVTKQVDANSDQQFQDSESISEGTPTTVTYKVTITNTSNAQDPVTLTSILDDQIANDAALLAAAIAANGNSATLAPGASLTFTYTSDAALTLNGNGQFVNTISVSGHDDEGTPASGGDTATVTGAAASPTITVTKQVDANSDQQFQDSESISEGTPTTVTYKVTITNTSNAQDPVTLTSILDDQIANDAALLAAAIAANGNSATLAPGASLTFTYTSDAALTLNGNGQFVNTISVSGHDDEGTPASGGDTATVTGAAASPTITVTKQVDANSDQQFQDSESISEGTPTTVTYKVTITNTSNAQDPVTLTSILDDQIANDAALLAAAIAANGNSATLAPGASLTFTYTSDAALTLNGNGQFVNTISVSGHDDEGTPASGGDTATVTATDHVPQVGAYSILADEDQLPVGNHDLPAPSLGDDAQSGVPTGFLPIDWGPDAAGATISFAGLHNALVGAQTSATNSPLTYFWNAGISTLYASTDATNATTALNTAAFSLVITNPSTGAYSVNLIQALEHTPANNTEDPNIVLSLNYTATDGDGSTVPGTLGITIDDDIPVAGNDEASVTAGQTGKNDLLLVVDVSGSMDTTVSGVPTDFGFGNTRLDLARLSLLQLINESNTSEVKFVLFATESSSTTWLTKDQAIAFVNNESNFTTPGFSTGGTDYDAALFDQSSSAIHAFDTLPATPSDGRLGYFISDGEPNEPGSGDNGIQSGEETQWITFLTGSNVQKVTAVGIGGLNATNADQLEPAAWQSPEIQTTYSTAASDPNVVLVDNNNLANLGNVLVSAVPNTTSGNLLTNDQFGADGGHLLSVTVGATTYTSNFSNVVTPQGGMLTVNFATGAWTYTTPTNIPAAVDDVFTYKIVDNDGDQAPASLTVHLSPVGSEPLIYTLLDHPYWTSDTATSAPHDNNQSFVNRIHFFDGDVPATIRVTIASTTAGDAFNELTSLAGVVIGSNGTNSVTLDGSIAAINQYLAENHLGWNPSGTDSAANNQVDRLVTITIDDNGTAAGGNIASKTILIDHQTPTTSNADNSINLAGFNVSEGTLNLNNGSDISVTAAPHGPSTGATTYDGGNQTDTITMVMAPWQLESILSDVGGAQSALQGFLDGNINSNVNLDTSAWNAIVNNFENATLALASGHDGVVIYTAIGATDANLPDYLAGLTGDNADNTRVGAAGSVNETLKGGTTSDSNEAAVDGNDILVGRDGNDTLWGGGGSDLVLGGAGNDQLHGGNGIDILSGGAGVDTFYFSAADANADGIPTTNADRIVDYSLMENDIIDVNSALTAAFSGPVTGWVKVIVTPGDSTSLTLQLDTNGGGDGFVDVAILDHHRQTASDAVKVHIGASDFLILA